MKTLARRVWEEEGVAIAVIAAAAQLAVFWPDWRAGLTAAATLASGAARGLRSRR